MMDEEGTQSDGCSSNQDSLKSYTNEHGPNFIDDADKAYIVLLKVLRYLSTKDLMSVRKVCKVWNLVGSDKIFWKKVDLSNCQVQPNIVGTLKKYGTETLDLRGGIFSSETWSSLCQALTEVTTLTDIIMEHCPVAAVSLLAEGIPCLKSLSAYYIEPNDITKHVWSCCNYLDLTPFKNMRALKTLKLVNYKPNKLLFYTHPTEKIELNFATFILTKSLNLSCIEHILPSTLVSLELGDCDSLSFSFCDIFLPKLVNLTRLRLQKCYNGNLTTKLVEKICKLPNLSELELINFKFSSSFEEAIAECANLKSLLIIPIYRKIPNFMHPLINQLILLWVSMLKNLKIFVWVVPDQMVSILDANLLNIFFSNIRVTACGDNIPVGRASDMNFIRFDEIQSEFWPDLKLKIVRTCFSLTWKLALNSFGNGNLLKVHNY